MWCVRESQAFLLTLLAPIYRKTLLALRNSSAKPQLTQMTSEEVEIVFSVELIKDQLTLRTCFGTPCESCFSDFWKNELESFRFLVTVMSDVILELH